MNKLMIIGRLTRDPELRSTPSGIPVCHFDIAVNRRKSSSAEAGQQPEADFFRVTAWRQLGENCARYLAKGRMASVIGSVSASAYTAKDGTLRASMEISADDVEFLSPRGEAGEGGSVPSAGGYAPSAAPAPSQNSGFVKVDDEELPF
ncbi:MAG: single-stranded DNA-binding protein [Christensenellales bacterium]